jgi:hypothetical protein
MPRFPLVFHKGQAGLPSVFKTKIGSLETKKRHIKKWAVFLKEVRKVLPRSPVLFSNKYSRLQAVRRGKVVKTSPQPVSVWLKQPTGQLRGRQSTKPRALKLWLPKKYRKKQTRGLLRNKARFLSRRKFKEYQYGIFFKKLTAVGIRLPFMRKKTKPIKKNPALAGGPKRLKLKKKNSHKKTSYSFFCLSFRKKKYRRRSPRSSSRKFFTNI